MAQIGRLHKALSPLGARRVNSLGLDFFEFSFETDGTNDPTNVRGENVLVERSAVGEYEVQLPYGYSQVVRALADLESTSLLGQDARAEIDGYDSATRKLTVRTAQRADVAYETVTITSEAGALTTAGPILYAEDTGTTPVGVLTIISSGTPSAGQVTVTYTAGVPSFETAAADAIDELTVLQMPSEAVAADLDGPRVNVTLAVRLSDSLAKTWTD